MRSPRERIQSKKRRGPRKKPWNNVAFNCKIEDKEPAKKGDRRELREDNAKEAIGREYLVELVSPVK